MIGERSRVSLRHAALALAAGIWGSLWAQARAAPFEVPALANPANAAHQVGKLVWQNNPMIQGRGIWHGVSPVTMIERLIGFCDTYPHWSGLGSWPLVAFTPAVPKPVLITVSWICGGDTRAGS